MITMKFNKEDLFINFYPSFQQHCSFTSIWLILQMIVLYVFLPFLPF